MHSGYCLPEYTVISDIALTANNALYCVLGEGFQQSAGGSGTGGGGGQWTGPDNTSVQCGGSGSGPFTCSQSSDPTSLTLYKKTEASFSGKQLYTCTISGQSISVLIENNSVLSAVYIQPPEGIKIPQEFNIYGITIEPNENIESITATLTCDQGYIADLQLSKQTDCNQQECTYSLLEIHWDGDTLTVDGTELNVQELTKYNEDQDWACGVTYSSNGYNEQLQTYIRVPSLTPTNLTVLHKNATSVTISWTAVDATEADGYAVYYGSYAADVGNVNEYTITKHILPGTMYTISIRAYQDLLGAASKLSTVTNQPIVLGPLNGTLVSLHTNLEVIYRVECITQYAAPEHIQWTVNSTRIINSTVCTNISYQLVNMTAEIWKSTLTIMIKEHKSQNISCEVLHSESRFMGYHVMVKAPSGPPVGVAASINSSSSITVNWSPPAGRADGYVILYSTEGSSNMTQLVEGGDQTSSLLFNLTKGYLYTIRVFAYKDLPSLLSHPVEVMLDVPDPVFDLKVMSISLGNGSVSWNSSLNHPAVWFTVVYYSITCQNHSNNYQFNVTTLSHTITNLQIGQEYNISVSVINIIGVSSATSLNYRVPSAVPGAPPQSVAVSSVNSSSIKVSWGDVLCDQRNGEITGYQVNYTSTSDNGIVNTTGNQTSVTLSDLQPHTDYSISVAAMTVNGTGPFSTPVTNKTLFTVPDPVDYIEFHNASSTSLFVSWTPSPDTEHIVDNYTILYSTTCEGQVRTSNFTVTNTSVIIKHLEEGMNYTIIIIAVNKIGEGQPAYSYAVTKEATPTGTPTITTAIAINENTAFISWKQVDCFMQNGFITHYNVTIVRSGDTIYSNNLSLSNEIETTLMEMFQSNMNYNVSVAAVNSAGTGPSTSSLIQTSAPGPVGALVAIMGQTNATLQWTEPTFNTYNGELTYEVLYGNLSATEECSSQLQMAVNNNTSNNYLHIKNLLPKTLYKFYVRAVSNIGGPGKETTTCNTTLPDESITTPSSAGTTQTLLLVESVAVLQSVTQSSFYPTTVTSQLVESAAVLQSVTQSSVDPTTGTDQTSFQTLTTTNILVNIGTGTPDTNLLIAAGVGGGVFVIISIMAVITISVIIAMSSRRLSKKPPIYNATEMFSFDQPDEYERIVPRPQPVIIEETDVSKDGADSIIDIQAGDLESAASVAYLYAALDTPALTVQEEEKERETETEFYQGIVPTHPIPVSELTTHVTSRHSDNKATFVEQFKNLYNGEDKTCTVAFSAKWRELNRFKNIAPYDDNLITLKPIKNCSVRPQEFINASFIDGYSLKNKYIAAQGPLKKTLSDFWWLIWQEHAMCVVMVTNTVENGKAKCEQYWPTTQQEPVAYGPFTVSLLDEQQLPNFVIRNLKVLLTDYPQSMMTVTQYHFTTWPDHGVPETSNPLIKLHKMVVACWRMVGGPILVHCSAGVGRTGTFITINLALEQAEMEGVVDIAGIVNRLREQRMKMVQTEAQYFFIHNAIHEALVCGDTSIPCNHLSEEIKLMEQMNKDTGTTGFQAQFELLHQVSPCMKEQEFSTALSNKLKNRSNEHIPSDRWRVFLKSEYPGYINASYAQGYHERRAFIIAQSPMVNTARDFWKMIVDYRVPAVVMLCDLIENEQETCFQYWLSVGVSKYDEFTVEVKTQEKGEWSLRQEIQVTKEGVQESWQVVHFHVQEWSTDSKLLPVHDHWVELIESVKRSTGGKGPVVVHCSDTVGRSSMYCAISNTLEQCKAEGVVDVFQTVKRLRMQKPGAISTLEQYKAVFDVINAYFHSTRTHFQQ